MSVRERGIVTGELPPGPTNSVVDVAGVSVGHVTLAAGQLSLFDTADIEAPPPPLAARCGLTMKSCRRLPCALTR